MVVTRATRNRFVGVEPARGFESHRLRQKPVIIILSVFLFDNTYKPESSVIISTLLFL